MSPIRSDVCNAVAKFMLQTFIRRLHGGRLASYLNFTVAARCHQRPIRVPLTGGIGFGNLYPGEQWMTAVLSVLLPGRAGAFVDVGVNVGQTMIKVKAFNPELPYIGFEPNPVCYSYSYRLIAENGFANCTLLPVGLSNTAAVAPLFINSDADVGGTTIPGFRSPEQWAEVRHVAVFPGDAMLATLDNPLVSVIKVDVEGAELEVLEGLRQTLDTRPFVLCEILPVFTTDCAKGRVRKPRQDRLLANMREAGYDLFRVLPDASAVPLCDVGIHGDPTLTNYLFAPREERAFVEATLVRKTTR
jgi:FkbM family methyltransferase